MKELILILTGTIGTLGFGFVMKLKKNRMIYAVIGGFLTSLIYVIAGAIFKGDFFINLVPTIIAVIYAESMARIEKAPVTVFMIPSLVPLIPGGALYQTMNCLIGSDEIMAAVYGIKTIKIAFSIAVGIVFVSSIYQYCFQRFKNER